jgi:predicted transcriptional regulator
MDRYSFFLPDDLKRGLTRLKARDGIDASEAIRQAIAQFLHRRGIVTDARQKGGTRTKRRR